MCVSRAVCVCVHGLYGLMLLRGRSTLAREIDTIISLFIRRPRYCVGILTSGVSVSLGGAASAGGPVGLLRYRQA